MAYPKRLKDKAQAMRRQGASILTIHRELGVAKSTASLWIRGIELPEELKRHLKRSSKTGCAAGRAVMAARRKARQVEREEEAKEAISGIMGSEGLSRRLFHQLCVALLYWCEGCKGPLASLDFVNSDPLMIKAYLRSLRSGFDVRETRFRVQMHLHEYHDHRTQQIFWSRVTGIPTPQFTRPYLKPHTGKNKRLGYPGCISVRYGDADLAKRVAAIYSEFANSKIMGAW